MNLREDSGMPKFLVVVIGFAGLLAAAFVANSAKAQSAPKTCSEAFSACTSKHHLLKECDAEKQWCVKTGSFADPKTKAVTSGLQKR
jgi:hypothetical protein